jgi:hypothetical protein
MENVNLPQTPTNDSPQKSLTLIYLIAGLVLALISGSTGYYLGLQRSQSMSQIDNKKVGVSPLPKNNEAVACTMEAKVCPDGSSVGRSGPNCEFAACPGEIDQSDWKIITDQNLFAGEFKVPASAYTAGQVDQNGDVHMFISNNPIVIPESWDSPFTPIEILFIKDKTIDIYTKKVEEAKGFYLPETLRLAPVVAGQQKGVILTGTFGDGYAGGGRVVQAFFTTNNGYANANYYGFVDKNFSEDLFKEIMNTLELK